MAEPKGSLYRRVRLEGDDRPTGGTEIRALVDDIGQCLLRRNTYVNPETDNRGHVWMSITTVFAILPDLAFEKWIFVMKIMLMTILTMTLMQSRERIHALVWVVVLSIGFFGVKGGVFFIVSGGEFRVWGPDTGTVGANNAIGLASPAPLRASP